MAPLELSDLPLELYLDHLLPLLELKDLANLTRTNKFFDAICNDETFWKRKIERDLNFNGAGTARTKDWKFLYKQYSKPELYVWGEMSRGRLGLEKFPSGYAGGIPYPTRLKIPGVRVVNLVAGGMSFHALDSEGNVHVWGTLDGSSGALEMDGFSEGGKTARTPLRLQMPEPIRTISCGRLHSAVLDSKKQIWNFRSWGRPFRLTHPVLLDHDHLPVQVECGWTFTSFLTAYGDVFVWWPMDGVLEQQIRERNQEMDQMHPEKSAIPEKGVIPCITWEIEHSPHKLPALPPLPSLHGYVADSEQDAPKLVQIAALDNHIIGLTNYGHVLKHGFLSDETNASRGQWEYLPNFSQTDLIKEDSIFATGKASLSQDLKITHITAHYLSFTAYSTGGDSIVLMGNADTTPDSRPQIIPELQNKSVISVILGDYHKGAVTSDGKLFTWGAFSSGALGLGDPASLPLGSPGGFPIVQNRAHQARRMMRLPEPVETPTEVRFDHKRTTKRKKFCIFAAAAGWHTGAVVIDQESDDDNEEESEPVTDVAQSHQMPSHPTGHPIRGPGETPPFVPGPGLGIFRIGLAGAGAFSSQGGAGPSNPSPQSHLRRRQEDFGFSDESHDT